MYGESKNVKNGIQMYKCKNVQNLIPKFLDFGKKC